MSQFDLLTAFLIGLAGAGHCFGMCGGIISALSFNTSSNKGLFTTQLNYNLGRITSYTILALIFSFFFQSFTDYYESASYALRTIAATVLFLMGLYLLKQSQLILKVEKLGSFGWQYISPFAKKLLPIRTRKQAFLAGFVWGWLPCGLVYSSLIWISARSTPLEAIILMLAFGLGTMPAMLATGIFSKSLKDSWKQYHLNTVSGIFMLIYAVWTFPFFQNLIQDVFTR
ncbi:MAG: sulfite exporter TauE/SafE family protein [Marinomonas sp.]|uniref:sulfite exporter TauE/SafE family protein n=1 Tax=unclassified Marinomonas TaxID=196814 RepID=UPI0007AEF7BD|nr:MULTISPECIES: sulfite exporter TauE/SafE family protein [unclassified Marinomonas]